jgi:hypothetical protein
VGRKHDQRPSLPLNPVCLIEIKTNSSQGVSSDRYLEYTDENVPV